MTKSLGNVLWSRNKLLVKVPQPRNCANRDVKEPTRGAAVIKGKPDELGRSVLDLNRFSARGIDARNVACLDGTREGRLKVLAETNQLV